MSSCTYFVVVGVEIKYHVLPIILKYILQGFTIKILKTYTGEWEKYIRLEVNTINTMKIGNEGRQKQVRDNDNELNYKEQNLQQNIQR